MEWRKKWEKVWAEVKYCSDRCRKAKTSLGPDLETQILALLKVRARGQTICPSEVLPPEQKSRPEEMEKVRQAARRLVASGQLEICQKGQVVDAGTFRGPIRLRLKS